MTKAMPRQSRGTLRDEVQALKRERVLMSAAELFYKNGYENTTLEAVGHVLGVTKPVIYGHFATKAELLAEICARGISSSLNAMKVALARETEPLAQLSLMAELFVQAVLENQIHIAIFTREVKNLHPEDFLRINNMRREFDHELRTILRRGADSGEFSVEDCNITALAIGGMVSWAYEWYRPNGRLSEVEIAREFSRLILKMVMVCDD